MAIAVIPCAIITGFWAIVGIVIPIFIPKGPNRGIVQLSLVLTAVTCWLFWLCTYMSQMNPLLGPKLKKDMILNIAREWGHAIPDLNTENSTSAH